MLFTPHFGFNNPTFLGKKYRKWRWYNLPDDSITGKTKKNLCRSIKHPRSKPFRTALFVPRMSINCRIQQACSFQRRPHRSKRMHEKGADENDSENKSERRKMSLPHYSEPVSPFLGDLNKNGGTKKKFKCKKGSKYPQPI